MTSFDPRTDIAFSVDFLGCPGLADPSEDQEALDQHLTTVNEQVQNTLNAKLTRVTVEECFVSLADLRLPSLPRCHILVLELRNTQLTEKDCF